MTESYCLKSCADCGREGCAGCRVDRFSGQCEIAACCREQHHDSCESCTRAAYCPTRANRDLMPQRVLSKERHAAEHAAEYRAKAELLAKWTKFIFWSLVITNALALLGLLPSLHPLETVGSCIAVLLTSYGMFRMRSIDRRFGQVAIWQALAGIFTALLPEVSAGESDGCPGEVVSAGRTMRAGRCRLPVSINATSMMTAVKTSVITRFRFRLSMQGLLSAAFWE